MKKRVIIFGVLVLLAISSVLGTQALSGLAKGEWSNYVQSWDTTGVIKENVNSIHVAKIRHGANIPVCGIKAATKTSVQ